MDTLHLIESIGTGWLIAEWTIRIAALFIVPRNRTPSSGTAWLLFIFFFPFLGILFFIVLGSPKLPKSRRDAQKNLDRIIVSSLSKFKDDPLLDADVPPEYRSIANLSQSLGHLPVFSGNSVEVLHEYGDIIERFAQEIDRATKFVHLEYFVVKLDLTTKPVFDALERATSRGVTVRVLYDQLSTRRLKDVKETMRRLKAMGAEAVPMLPFRFPGRGYVRPDLRNHRKILIVDGRVAFTGSLNMVQRDYHRKDDIYYDELVIRSVGPIALQFGAVFMSDWYAETGEILEEKSAARLKKELHSAGDSLAQVLPSGSGYDDQNNLKLFTSLIHTAEQRIVITNPYFVPDDALTTAITSAARRGVEVVMINSEAMDQWMVGHAQRSYYQILLEAGVKIYLYRAPVLLHSKFMTIDGKVATVGSSNFDIRSFSLNLEVTNITYDPRVAAKLDAVAKMYLAKSNRVALDQWLKRPRRQQLLDNIARLTAALQ